MLLSVIFVTNYVKLAFWCSVNVNTLAVCSSVRLTHLHIRCVQISFTIVSVCGTWTQWRIHLGTMEWVASDPLCPRENAQN